MVQFNTIEEALEDLRQGKIILVTEISSARRSLRQRKM